MPKESKRERYDSELSDKEWEIIQPLLPPPAKTGRPLKYPLRDFIDAIFYVVKTGCQWRMIPHDYPPPHTVYYHFCKLRDQDVWQDILTALGRRVRAGMGRDEDPSLLLIDSQSAPTQLADEDSKGYDGGKKIKGRKRHLVTDSLGIVLSVLVTGADVQDAIAAPQVLEMAIEQGRTGRVEAILVDKAYLKLGFPDRAKELLGRDVSIETTTPRSKERGFQVAPKRWAVERSNAWTLMARRMSRDVERLIHSSKAMIEAAHVRLFLRRSTK